MSELLPCPFCGGEANTLHKPHVIDMRYSVGCNDDECRGFIGLSWLYKTEAEAVAAWNTRADTEYGAVPATEENMAKYGWVRERTCECIAEYAKSPIDGKTIVLHRCSGCHELMRPHMSYCPSCGGKVVDR